MEKMTKAQAQDFVKNTKFFVSTGNESKLLQEKLFKIGCEWNSGAQEVYGTGNPFLYVDEHLHITFGRKECFHEFVTHSNQYKQTKDIFKIKLYKQKFNPKTLQPFDRVLVRQNVNDVWKARFFDRYFCKQFITTDGLVYNYCIPYNDENKHMHGEIDEAPEFYKLD